MLMGVDIERDHQIIDIQTAKAKLPVWDIFQIVFYWSERSASWEAFQHRVSIREDRGTTSKKGGKCNNNYVFHINYFDQNKKALIVCFLTPHRNYLHQYHPTLEIKQPYRNNG